MRWLKGNTYTKSLISLALLALFYACTKQEPFDTASQEKFAGRYCNDPIAINYNHGFPGTADNSICIYPTDVFQGSFVLKDSVYDADFNLDTVLDYMVKFNTISLTNTRLSGFCINGDTVRLTADRYYRAAVDSTMLPDSSMIEGHVFCRGVDTIKGNILKIEGDTPKIRINFIIASDTGINYHIGTGIKQ
ncbi:MAG: hypothetical protein H3C54_03075 [Taibaiella sp.]|nr:hypothetical protein [Taibaiella sp.]